jgi:hypothetical protein
MDPLSQAGDRLELIAGAVSELRDLLQVLDGGASAHRIHHAAPSTL